MDRRGLVSLHRGATEGGGEIMRRFGRRHAVALRTILALNARGYDLREIGGGQGALDLEFEMLSAFYGLTLAFWNPAIAAAELAPMDWAVSHGAAVSE